MDDFPGPNVVLTGVGLWSDDAADHGASRHSRRSRYTHFIIYPSGDVVDGAKSDGTSIVPGWFQKLAPPHNFITVRYNRLKK